ncbi:MAG: hypothetical protein ABIG96_01795 [Candidatus Micrarchaeota archaeon]
MPMYIDLIFLIPLLLALKFLDSYLTVWAYRNYHHYARKFVMLESYEANPNWKKDVEHGFKDWKHFSFVVFLIIILSYVYSWDSSSFWYEFLSGFSVFLYLAINFEHLTHMREMELMPGRVKGRILYTLDYYFSTATHNYVKFSAILLFAWIATQSNFILGGIFGPLLIATLIRLRWQVYSESLERG